MSIHPLVWSAVLTMLAVVGMMVVAGVGWFASRAPEPEPEPTESVPAQDKTKFWDVLTKVGLVLGIVQAIIGLVMTFTGK